MRWEEVREQYPEQWLVVEALEAYTEDGRRKLEQMTGAGIAEEVCDSLAPSRPTGGAGSATASLRRWVQVGLNQKSWCAYRPNNDVRPLEPMPGPVSSRPLMPRPKPSAPI